MSLTAACELMISAFCRPTGSGQSGNLVTATFSSIPSNTQRTVWITTTVRDLPTVTQGGSITDQARFDYSTNPAGLLPSNVVTTGIQEPNVDLSKSVDVPRDPLGAGDSVTYTLILHNTGRLACVRLGADRYTARRCHLRNHAAVFGDISAGSGIDRRQHSRRCESRVARFRIGGRRIRLCHLYRPDLGCYCCRPGSGQSGTGRLWFPTG